MNRTIRQVDRSLAPGQDEDSDRSLPQLSAAERDFWRRAVAEQRSRLEIAEAGTRALVWPDRVN